MVKLPTSAVTGVNSYMLMPLHHSALLNATDRCALLCVCCCCCCCCRYAYASVTYEQKMSGQIGGQKFTSIQHTGMLNIADTHHHHSPPLTTPIPPHTATTSTVLQRPPSAPSPSPPSPPKPLPPALPLPMRPHPPSSPPDPPNPPWPSPPLPPQPPPAFVSWMIHSTFGVCFCRGAQTPLAALVWVVVVF